jgi:DNA polymerase III subunit epsilon
MRRTATVRAEAVARTEPRLRNRYVSAAEMRIDDVAFCVVDVETTGLQPGIDRVLEIAVVRCDSAGSPVDEWHTLVHPKSPVDGECVHGINDAMVAAAPTFDELLPRLLSSLDGAVLVAHNAAFDRRFIEEELARAGHPIALPYLCTMHMRRHVGLAAPVMHRLSWACWQAGTPMGQAHAAVSDARAVASLLAVYLRQSRLAGHELVGQLAMTAAAAQACQGPLLVIQAAPIDSDRLLPCSVDTVAHEVARAMPTERAVGEYRHAVSSAVEDFVLDGDEVDELHSLVVALGLSADEVAEAHRAFLRDRLNDYLDDDELTWEEYEQLRVLARLLAVDGRWLEELVTNVRPHYAALTLDSVAADLGEDQVDLTLQAPLSVCFTGPFEAMPLTRADVQALAADAGMLVRPGVSAKLDLLVCRDLYAGTSKLRAAEKHGTVVIDQETFLAIAGAATPSPSPVAAVLNQVGAQRRARVRPSPGAPLASAEGRSRPEPANASRLLTGTMDEQVLWCEAGGHEWTRPAPRGRPPKCCVEHRAG